MRKFDRSFFKSEKALYASFWIFPNQPAVEAPKAFNVEKEVEPAALVIPYSGSFMASETGNFRFYGRADDILIVRINGKIVLDGSAVEGTYTDWKTSSGETGAPLFGQLRTGIYGDWFKLQANKSYDIDIIVGEVPGGDFGCWLTFQKEGGEPKIFSTRSLNDKEKSFLKRLHPDSRKFL